MLASETTSTYQMALGMSDVPKDLLSIEPEDVLYATVNFTQEGSNPYAYQLY